MAIINKILIKHQEIIILKYILITKQATHQNQNQRDQDIEGKQKQQSVQKVLVSQKVNQFLLQMLEINSRISLANKGSKLSNDEQKETGPTKITSLTDQQSLQEPSNIINSSQGEAKHQRKNKKMIQRISQIQIKQKQIKKTMEAYLLGLEKEIIRREKLNQELKNEISTIKNELNDSKNDVGILNDFLSKVKTTDQSNPKKLTNKHITNRISFHSKDNFSPPHQSWKIKKTTF